MKGKVVIFNAVRGLGFIDGENGIRYFFSQRDLTVLGFRAIAVGRDVEFTASTRDDRPVANGIKAVNGDGVQTASPLPRAILSTLDEGNVLLLVDTLGRIYTKENLFPFKQFIIAPTVWVEGAFRAFKTDGIIRELTVRLPSPTREQVFLALDPNKKVLPPSNQFQLEPGSYILSLRDNGDLDIQSIGRRHQSEKGGENWVVLEHRFRHTLNLQEDLASQIPTSGLERDNNGFIPAIEEAIALLNQRVMAS